MLLEHEILKCVRCKNSLVQFLICQILLQLRHKITKLKDMTEI